MYREQNYIFSFTFVYKPKMASLVKITKKHKKKKKKKRRNFSSILWMLKILHLCICHVSYFFFPLVWTQMALFFFTVT